MGVAVVTPHQTPRTNSSTRLSPLRSPRSVVPASPTRYTSHRSLPRKTGTRLERPRETGNLPAPHSSSRWSLPIARTSTHPPAEHCHDEHTVPSHALPAPPTLPISL